MPAFLKQEKKRLKKKKKQQAATQNSFSSPIVISDQDVEQPPSKKRKTSPTLFDPASSYLVVRPMELPKPSIALPKAPTRLSHAEPETPQVSTVAVPI